MKASLLVLSAALLAGGLSLAQCGGTDGDPPPSSSCVENLNVDCTMMNHSPPAYSTIYRYIIQPQCTLGSSCHSADGAMGNLVLADADATYDTLLGSKGGIKHVLPNDPQCSPLMVRLESSDPNYVMPRGSRLTEPELCEIVQWIKQGAPKN